MWESVTTPTSADAAAADAAGRGAVAGDVMVV